MRFFFLLLFLVSNLVGCSSVKSVFQGSTENANDIVQSEETLHAQLEAVLRAELKPWKGTPHVLGGNTMQGVDCSGLIKEVFADALNVEIPRTTGQLIQTGKSVRKSKLIAGDLVFFSPAQKKGGHVGIYLSSGEFTHASSSRGVMTSNLSNPYWSKHYETSRRILDETDELRAAIERVQARQKLAIEMQSGN
ncbi:MAG: NlpC/P60 family protein [Rhodothermales bacterium]|nr:NlpC/P60 family protein [Rhodothermales bacterium]MDG2017519.1 NlpC/P60 family protein [Rhodothermales bacterium]HAY37748.1 hypothetical protein [Bacteroidota bacterium]